MTPARGLSKGICEGQRPEPLKQGAKGRRKWTQNSTPSEPPELRARTFDFPLWLKYPFSECPRLE